MIEMFYAVIHNIIEGVDATKEDGSSSEGMQLPNSSHYCIHA